VRPIAAVSTSVGAFIDYFAEGTTGRAVQIFGMADFERNFGRLDPNSAASYQIAQFFLNGGASAWVVRVTPADAATADIIAKDAFKATALNPGAWGNSVRLTVEPVIDPATAKVSDKLFNLYVSRYAAPDDTGAPIVTEKYPSVSIDSASSRYFETIVKTSSQLIKLEHDSAAKLPQPSGSFGGSIVTTNTFDKLDGKKFTIKLGSGTAQPCTIIYKDVDKDLSKLRGAVESAIRIGGGSVPGLAGATVTLIGDRLQIEAGGRTPGYSPADVLTIGPGAGPDTTVVDVIGFGASSTPTPTNNVQEYTLGSQTNAGAQVKDKAGADGDAFANAASKAAFTTALLGDANLKTGLHALDDVDLFNILCVPVAVELDDATTNTNFTAIMTAAVTYCEARRAFLIVDIPSTVNTPQKVQDWLNTNASTVKSANSAVYFPRVEVPDPANAFQLRSIGASGTMAGIYARTDTDRGVWKAPAGIDTLLRGVGALDYLLTDGENGVLNPLGIDCLRVFPVYGQVAWGARTLLGADVMASEWKYVPIRRLALMIEESLFRGTKWVVFEPNDEPLWAKIRQNVGAFMMGLFRQGAFQGGTPDKAFFVKCDGETTTANDRNLGIVNIEVGFAPLKPAEFVVLKIQQIPDIV
jgi:hypothetical protein